MSYTRTSRFPRALIKRGGNGIRVAREKPTRVFLLYSSDRCRISRYVIARRTHAPKYTRVYIYVCIQYVDLQTDVIVSLEVT